MIVVRAELVVDVLLDSLSHLAGGYVRGSRLNVPVEWMRCCSVDWIRRDDLRWLLRYTFRDTSSSEQQVGTCEQNEGHFPEFDSVYLVCEEGL